MKRFIKVILLVVCAVFLALQVLKLDVQAAAARAILVILLCVLYYIKVQEKRFLFLMFLVSFALGEILNFSSYFVIPAEGELDFYYYGANILYIISYIFLIIRVMQNMHLKKVISKFWMHIVILAVLDVFCVNIVSGTTEDVLTMPQSWLEYIYNSVIMFLLTVAMINYISKNSQKAMNILLGAIFIFFSEVIQYTYFYISEVTVLNVVCSLFLLLAFFFFYLQSRIGIEEENNEISRDQYI